MGIPWLGISLPVMRAKMHVGLQARYSCPILTKTLMCQQILVEFPSINFNRNSFSLSLVLTCGSAQKARDSDGLQRHNARTKFHENPPRGYLVETCGQTRSALYVLILCALCKEHITRISREK
jgi:hypothetical protein